jgi:hypothetical protein
MYKWFAITVAVLFFPASVTYSDIGQAESFQINSGNQITLSCGPGSVIGSNSFIVGQNQAAAKTGGDFSIALQNQTGLLSQMGCAVSLTGILSGIQQAELAGRQKQSSSSQQEQNQAANLAQDIDKDKSIGGIIIGQGAVIGQVQITADGSDIKGEAAFSGITQIDGNAIAQGSNFIINNLLTIGTIP